MVALVRDKRGAILVQTVVILPILILVVFGGFEVWKVMSVKGALTSGTSEAARYLSFNHEGKNEAERIIRKELSNNDLIGNTPLALNVRYYNASGGPIGDPAGLSCEEEFSVEAEVRLPWDITIPGLSPISYLSITTERQAGKIWCTE
jgi:hypothetical protein